MCARDSTRYSISSELVRSRVRLNRGPKLSLGHDDDPGSEPAEHEAKQTKAPWVISQAVHRAKFATGLVKTER